MRGTAISRVVSSIAVVAVLSTFGIGCGSDEASDDVETSTGMVDEPGDPEVSYIDDSLADPDVSVADPASDDLQEYIDSLAATTDNFDGLTTTPEETTCAATAVLTPIGVEVLKIEEVSVENVDPELDVLEFTTPESAVGIADGLVACGLGPRFAASFAEGESTEDLDAAAQLELRDCVGAMLDDATAQELLAGYLTPAGSGETWSPERADAGLRMAGMVSDCGFDPRPYP